MRLMLAPSRLMVAVVMVLSMAAFYLLLFQGGFQSLSLQVVSWQRDFHRALTLAVTDLSGTPSPMTWLTLLGISFGYGVFHAAGPGHGKAVLATYLLSQGGARRRALGLSFAASLLQGLVAISLVVVLVYGLGWLTRQAMGSVVWVEQMSFFMVALVGIWLCLRAIRQLRRPAIPVESPAASGSHHTEHECQSRHIQHPGHHCCGGDHHVEPGQVTDWRTALATVVAIGIRPCSGGVLILGAAALLDQFMVGVAAVLVMSLGTALTVSALALASVVARGWAERRLARQTGARQLSRFIGWTSLAGGLAIVSLGVSLTITGVNQPANAPLLSEPPSRGAGTAAPRPHPFGG